MNHKVPFLLKTTEINQGQVYNIMSTLKTKLHVIFVFPITYKTNLQKFLIVLSERGPHAFRLQNAQGATSSEYSSIFVFVKLFLLLS